MTTPSPQPTLHVLSLLAQISSRQASGCLQVMTPTTTWFLYLEHGELTYATTAEQAFDRLDTHLRRLSSQAPGLVSAVRVQVRLLFEPQPLTVATCPDYQALGWLVEQRHLHPNQAATLIESLCKEVIEAFLEVREGHYELLEDGSLGHPFRYSHLNLRTTVEECYARMRQRRNGAASPGNLPQRRGDPSPPPSPSATAGNSPLTYAAQPEPPAIKAGAKSHYTIACIDDSPTVLRAINDFLDDKMFAVIMIDDPVKALMQIIRNKPDLILLDVTMPSLDGYELCSLLRRHPDFKNTPIIMVTSNTGLIDRAKAKLVRASGYLTKPFSQSDLLKFIFRYLN
jgi:two-component system, chemotaxis family, response regulator PixG